MSTKTFASGVLIQLGVLNVIADAVPIRRTGSEKAASFRMVCPEHQTSPPAQRYWCEECKHMYEPQELARARELEDGSLRPFDGEQVTAVREAGIEEGSIELHVCDAQELESKVRPDGQAYRLRLGKVKGGKKALGRMAEAYALLRTLASRDDVALYGLSRLNGRCSPTPFRLVVWRDQLLLQSFVRPEDLTEAEEIDSQPQEALLELGQQFIEALREPFDATVLKDERRAKLAEILDSGVAQTSEDIEIAGEEPDLLAVLAASLQQRAAA